MPQLERETEIVNKKVSRLVVGTSRVATSKNPDGSFSAERTRDEWEVGILKQAWELGMNSFDTARVYGDAEVIIGKFLEDVPREQAFVVTKIGKNSIIPEDLLREADESARRLGLSPDILMIHDRHEGLMGQEMDNAIKTVNDLIDKGYATGIGISNFRPQELTRAIKVSSRRIAVYQAKANLTNSRPDLDELLEICRQNKINFMASSALNRGELPQDSDASINTEIMFKYGLSVAQFGLIRLLAQNIMPVVQSHNAQHMRENIRVFSIDLDESDLRKISER